MSSAADDFDDDDFDGLDGDDLVKRLRKLHKQEVAARKAAEAKAAELEKETRASKLADAFKDAEVPKGFAKLYDGEPTKDAIKAWWKDTAADFGLQADDEQPVDDATIDAADRIRRVADMAPVPTPGSLEERAAKIATMDFGEAVKQGLIHTTGF